MPGSTPTAVPTVTPTSAQNRLIGVSATVKPWASAAKVSMKSRTPPAARRCGRLCQTETLEDPATGQVQAKPIIEENEGDCGDRQADPGIEERPAAAEGARDDDEHGGGRQDPAERQQQYPLDDQ